MKKNGKIEYIFNSEVIEYIPNEKTKKLGKIKIINNKTKETSEMDMDGVL